MISLILTFAKSSNESVNCSVSDTSDTKRFTILCCQSILNNCELNNSFVDSIRVTRDLRVARMAHARWCGINNITWTDNSTRATLLVRYIYMVCYFKPCLSVKTIQKANVCGQGSSMGLEPMHWVGIGIV